jgi:hypothetical protein
MLACEFTKNRDILLLARHARVGTNLITTSPGEIMFRACALVWVLNLFAQR